MVLQPYALERPFENLIIAIYDWHHTHLACISDAGLEHGNKIVHKGDIEPRSDGEGAERGKGELRLVNAHLAIGTDLWR